MAGIARALRAFPKWGPRGVRLRRQSRAELIDRYARANRQCAEIIVANPVRYPGLMQDWARAILSDRKPERPQWRLAA